MEVTVDVAASAAGLVDEHVLSGADAIHLASALVFGGPDTVMVAWDRRLHTAARASGLVVAPANL